MAETIESFVSRLQDEGVKAGQQAARKIRDDAQKQADQLIADAKAKAAKLVDDAKKQAEQVRQRTQTELQLAARDTVLKLRDTLAKVVGGVLAAGVQSKLDDPEFLGNLLKDVVHQYAQADAAGKEQMEVRLSEDMQKKLLDWGLSHIQGNQDKVQVDLKGTLAAAGFEYSISGGNVEMSQAALVAALRELISPKLQQLLDEAVGAGSPPQDAQDAGGQKEPA